MSHEIRLSQHPAIAETSPRAISKSISNINLPFNFMGVVLRTKPEVLETLDFRDRYILLARLDQDYLTFKDIGKRLNLSEYSTWYKFSRSITKIWQNTPEEIQEAYPLDLIKESLSARTLAVSKSAESAARMRKRFKDPKLKQKLSEAQLKRFQDPEQMITIWKTKRKKYPKLPKPPKTPEEIERDAEKLTRFLTKRIAYRERRARDESIFEIPQPTQELLRHNPSQPKSGETENSTTIRALIKDPKMKLRFIHMICDKNPELKTSLKNYGIDNTAFSATLWNFALEKGLVDYSLSHKVLNEAELQLLSDYFNRGIKTNNTQQTIRSFYVAAIGLLG